MQLISFPAAHCRGRGNFEAILVVDMYMLLPLSKDFQWVFLHLINALYFSVILISLALKVITI